MKQCTTALVVTAVVLACMEFVPVAQVSPVDQSYASVRVHAVKKDPQGGAEHRVLTDVFTSEN